MKKIRCLVLAIGVLLFLQLPVRVVAANIDEATAKRYGTYYLSMMNGGKMIDASQVSLAYKFMNEDLGIAAAYIFNVEDMGYVIVSGSDLWYPILGYSTEGLLDTNRMAPAFKWYFESMCQNIIYSQNTGLALITNIEDEWDELRYEKLECRPEKTGQWLLESEWGQGPNVNPTYNAYCPHKTVNGEEQYALVGCLATALAQIMKYWEYPVEPKDGYIGYNCYLDGSYYDYVDIDLNDVVYDYAHMPNKLTERSTQEEKDAVAQLCYHTGVSIKMEYGLYESMSNIFDVEAAMKNVFLYDDTMMLVGRTTKWDDTAEDVYTNEEWVDMMTEEINAQRPIFYFGRTKYDESGNTTGHAFVCDGKDLYNGSKFHINWGWDGQQNTWCDVRNNELPVYDWNYNIYQHMLRFLQPQQNESQDTTGIDNAKVQLQSAYPNPAETEIRIGYNMNGGDVDYIYVYNIKGELMDRVKINGGDTSVRLNVSQYPNGVYVYRVGGMSRKFVVK